MLPVEKSSAVLHALASARFSKSVSPLLGGELEPSQRMLAPSRALSF